MICQTDGQHQQLIRAEPMTAFGIGRERVGGGGLFEGVLDMKTVLLCFVPACGSF